MDRESILKAMAPLLSGKRELAPNECYGEDGLIYCSICNEPKQAFIDILGEKLVRTRHCACDNAELDARDAMLEKQKRQFEAERLRAEAFSDVQFARCRMESDDHSNEKLSNIIRGYVANFDKLFSAGKGLLLYGPVGTGKSFAAACIANALIDRGRACLMTTMTRLVETMNESPSRIGYRDSLQHFDLLVIDDFGVERNSDYMNEQVFTIVDERVRSCKPMIVTSNLSREVLIGATELSKQRVLSRIKAACTPFCVEGKDRRVQQLVDSYGGDMALLMGSGDGLS